MTKVLLLCILSYRILNWKENRHCQHYVFSLGSCKFILYNILEKRHVRSYPNWAIILKLRSKDMEHNHVLPIHLVDLTSKLYFNRHSVTSSFPILQFNKSFLDRLIAFNKLKITISYRVLPSPYTVLQWQVVYFLLIENSLNDLAHTILASTSGVAKI